MCSRGAKVSALGHGASTPFSGSRSDDDDDVMYYYKAQLAVAKMAPVTPHILFLWDGS